MEFFDIDLDSADLRIVVWDADCALMKQWFAEGKKPYVEVAKEYFHDPIVSTKIMMLIKHSKSSATLRTTGGGSESLIDMPKALLVLNLTLKKSLVFKNGISKNFLKSKLGKISQSRCLSERIHRKCLRIQRIYLRSA
jgi:hypothetical protein